MKIEMFRHDRSGMSYAEDVLTAADDEVVCWCSQVSKGTILAAIRTGADSLDAIRASTGACTVGRCKELSPRGRCCSVEIGRLLAAENLHQRGNG